VTAISPVYVTFYQGVTGRAGYALHDPLALAIALDPSLVTELAELDVQVETHSPLTLGMTVADRRPLLGPGYPKGEHAVQIPLAVDRERFMQRLMDALLS
jgi:purine nucleosidase